MRRPVMYLAPPAPGEVRACVICGGPLPLRPPAWAVHLDEQDRHAGAPVAHPHRSDECIMYLGGAVADLREQLAALRALVVRR